MIKGKGLELELECLYSSHRNTIFNDECVTAVLEAFPVPSSAFLNTGTPGSKLAVLFV